MRKHKNGVKKHKKNDKKRTVNPFFQRNRIIIFLEDFTGFHYRDRFGKRNENKTKQNETKTTWAANDSFFSVMMRRELDEDDVLMRSSYVIGRLRNSFFNPIQ